VGNLVDNYGAIIRNAENAAAARDNALWDYEAKMKELPIKQQNADSEAANAKTNAWEASIKNSRLQLDKQIEISAAKARDASITKDKELADKYSLEAQELTAKRDALVDVENNKWSENEVPLATKLKLGMPLKATDYTHVPGTTIALADNGQYIELPEDKFIEKTPASNAKREQEVDMNWMKIANFATKPVDKDGNEIEGGGVPSASIWNEKAPEDQSFGFIVNGPDVERFDLPRKADGTQMTLGEIRKIGIQKADGTEVKLRPNDQMKLAKFYFRYVEDEGKEPSDIEMMDALKED